MYFGGPPMSSNLKSFLFLMKFDVIFITAMYIKPHERQWEGDPFEGWFASSLMTEDFFTLCFFKK